MSIPGSPLQPCHGSPALYALVPLYDALSSSASTICVNHVATLQGSQRLGRAAIMLVSFGQRPTESQTSSLAPFQSMSDPLIISAVPSAADLTRVCFSFFAAADFFGIGAFVLPVLPLMQYFHKHFRAVLRCLRRGGRQPTTDREASTECGTVAATLRTLEAQALLETSAVPPLLASLTLQPFRAISRLFGRDRRRPAWLVSPLLPFVPNELYSVVDELLAAIVGGSLRISSPVGSLLPLPPDSVESFWRKHWLSQCVVCRRRSEALTALLETCEYRKDTASLTSRKTSPLSRTALPTATTETTSTGRGSSLFFADVERLLDLRSSNDSSSFSPQFPSDTTHPSPPLSLGAAREIFDAIDGDAVQLLAMFTAVAAIPDAHSQRLLLQLVSLSLPAPAEVSADPSDAAPAAQHTNASALCQSPSSTPSHVCLSFVLRPVYGPSITARAWSAQPASEMRLHRGDSIESLPADAYLMPCILLHPAASASLRPKVRALLSTWRPSALLAPCHQCSSEPAAKVAETLTWELVAAVENSAAKLEAPSPLMEGGSPPRPGRNLMSALGDPTTTISFLAATLDDSFVPSLATRHGSMSDVSVSSNAAALRQASSRLSALRAFAAKDCASGLREAAGPRRSVRELVFETVPRWHLDWHTHLDAHFRPSGEGSDRYRTRVEALFGHLDYLPWRGDGMSPS